MNPATSRRHASHEAAHGMRPLPPLLPLDEALSLCLDLARPIGRRETVSLSDALHRVIAEDIRASLDVPSADRAAMDGYAVVARDTSHAGKFSPAVFRVQENVHAGDVPTKRAAKGRCSQIATGAPMPRGTDAVVMVEDTERERDTVKVFRPVRTRENVSARGSDIRNGSLVLARGEMLTPAKVGALAAIGRQRASVYARPRVALLVTGDEVVPPGARLRPGQVYDINSHTMAAAVREAGGEPVFLGRVPDRLDALHDALAAAVQEDLVVFSGGSSVGEKDLVIDALRSLGELLFHGIAIKPGRPTVLGRVRGKAVLGMPGNPTSCLSNCYILLAPMLRKMARRPPSAGRVIDAPLAAQIRSPLGRVEVHTVRLVRGQAVPAFKESGAITSMAHADGYVEIPADVGLVEKGETVRVTLF
jgi:molybdopterin molybdotransferase